MNKKGQTGGLITGLVFGIASLIIAIILAFVIVGAIRPIGNDIYSISNGPSATNESITGLAEAGDALAANYLSGCSATVSAVVNNSDAEPILATGNYTVTGCTIYGVALSPFLTYDVDVTYTTTYHSSTQSGEYMAGNFTEGIDNISSKVPTVLLIAAIILIISILAVLVGVWQRMRIGESSL